MDERRMHLLGVDCATVPQRTGLALGELRGSTLRLLKVVAGHARGPSLAELAARWVSEYDVRVVALDAPLGWPRAMHSAFAQHEAGTFVVVEPGLLFNRETDREIRRRLGKRPLEVGADRIARTALAALRFLHELRQLTGCPIPIALNTNVIVPPCAIEVYPAATRIGHGLRDKAGCLEGLDGLIDFDAVGSPHGMSEHVIDAAVCVLAAADFVSARAVPPDDPEVARIEGWIWAQ